MRRNFITGRGLLCPLIFDVGPGVLATESDELGVEELGGEGAGKGFYDLALLRGELGQFGVGAG